MIQSFDDKLAEAVFHGLHTHGVRKKFPSHLVRAIERKLDILNAAENLESLRTLPSLQADSGVRDAHGKHSIPIDEKWRIAFGWNDGPENVEIKSA